MKSSGLTLKLLVSGLLGGLIWATAAHAQPPLQALPSILQLQLSQHPAWRAYKDAAAETHADGAQAASRASELNAMSTPQRLSALRADLQMQRQAFERQAAATEAFYSVLSPEQRHIFDEVTQLPLPPSGAGPRRSRAAARNSETLRLPSANAPLPPPG